MERYQAYRGRLVKRRIRAVAEDIRDRFETDSFMEDAAPALKTIEKKLLGMFRMKTTMALYRDFYRFNKLSDKLALPAKNTLEWADVYPFLFIRAAFEGLRTNKSLRHLVIDEMQDYTAVQYAVINKLFDCPKTI
jgi:DNA helicase-2/ATP-dependent DNA helicase PcrA